MHTACHPAYLYARGHINVVGVQPLCIDGDGLEFGGHIHVDIAHLCYICGRGVVKQDDQIKATMRDTHCRAHVLLQRQGKQAIRMVQ